MLTKEVKDAMLAMAVVSGMFQWFLWTTITASPVDLKPTG